MSTPFTSRGAGTVITLMLLGMVLAACGTTSAPAAVTPASSGTPGASTPRVGTPTRSPTATSSAITPAQLITVAQETYRTFCNGESTSTTPVPVGATCSSVNDAVMFPCSDIGVVAGSATPLADPYADCPFTAAFAQAMTAVAPDPPGHFGEGAAQLCQCQGQESVPAFRATVTPAGGTVTFTQSGAEFVLTIVSDDGQLLVDGISVDGTPITQHPYVPSE